MLRRFFRRTDGSLRRWRVALVAWIAALILSNIVQPFVRLVPPLLPEGAVRSEAPLPAQRADGPVEGRTVVTSFLDWPPPEGSPPAPPVILLHGCPGQGSDFGRMAPLLAAAGRRVIAPDLHGFGASEGPPDYSIAADARTILALMDHLHIERAHVLGWSQGGGAAIWMSHLAPDRVASATLLASIGRQDAEGSGSYRFEHAKYGAGFVGLVMLPELIPHFGLLGERSFRLATVRSFWDSDQRPIKGIMKDLSVPTLIVHGRRDFLIAPWCAELSHRTIPGSRLVMLDASHFMPFTQPDLAAAHLLPFLARHDVPGVPPLPGEADFAPRTDETRFDLGPVHGERGSRWWLIILLIIVATFISEDATVIAVGLAIAHQQIDLGVGLLGCFIGIAVGDGGLYLIGRVFGRRILRWPFIRAWISEASLERWGRWFDRHTVKAVFLARVIPGTRMPTYIAAGLLTRKTHHFLIWAAIAAFLWTPVVLTLAILLGPRVLEALLSVFAGPVAVIIAIVVVLVTLRTLTYAFTWEGRRRLLRDATLPFRAEFWPSWAFYLPMTPYFLWLALRWRAMTFTCANPGIPHGGGVVGESRIHILSRLSDADPWVVPTAFIDAGPGPDERAERALTLIRDDARFGGYPVILKPDAGQRGHGLRLARSDDDVRDYFRDMTRPALLQRYHPGPEEAGILWARIPGQPRGFIFSVTRKVFPVITGNGRDALDRLIWKHPRFRMQADTFLKRHDAERDLILAEGQTKRLAIAGNHCQGTKFLDGADLITPELEKRFDQIALSFEGQDFDFGRFDIRYTSDEELRRGEGFAIVELNGAMSESTNMYDPTRSIFWTYALLARHWRLLVRIGHARRRMGVKPMPLRDLLHAVRDHYRGRPGSEVSD
ncbi:MAG: alpha/beta fold hydrolase [Phycisphaerales bacterium]|nr:alpha/beta fold hydrolase [Phycisphaerales bacterium]